MRHYAGPAQPTDEALAEALHEAVQNLHRCTASRLETVHVVEEYEGERVWEGDVYVFALEGHPTAQKAYAWSAPVPGSEKRRFYAVLHEGPVDSPEKAVRAAVVQEFRKEIEK